MTEDEWLMCEDPREMIGRVLHGACERKLRLFAVACCRCSRQLLSNENHRLALEISERFADGRASEKELRATYQRANTFACALHEDSEAEREIRRWAEATAVANATHTSTPEYHMSNYAGDAAWMIHRASRRNPNERLVALLRDIFGNPFRPVAFSPGWRTDTAVSIAAQMYDSRDFSAMPILADALQDAGCDNDDILNHCRGPVPSRPLSLAEPGERDGDRGEHVRGCWVTDLVLGRL